MGLTRIFCRVPSVMSSKKTGNESEYVPHSEVLDWVPNRFRSVFIITDIGMELLGKFLSKKVFWRKYLVEKKIPEKNFRLRNYIGKNVRSSILALTDRLAVLASIFNCRLISSMHPFLEIRKCFLFRNSKK